MGATLLDYLNEDSATETLSKEPLTKGFLKVDIKKSEDSEILSSSEEVKVGIENVKSETFSRELIAEKKDETETNSEEQTELQHWNENTWIQDKSTYEAQKMRGGLQLEAESSKEEEYGYIVTEKE